MLSLHDQAHTERPKEELLRRLLPLKALSMRDSPAYCKFDEHVASTCTGWLDVLKDGWRRHYGEDSWPEHGKQPKVTRDFGYLRVDGFQGDRFDFHYPCEYIFCLSQGTTQLFHDNELLVQASARKRVTQANFNLLFEPAELGVLRRFFENKAFRFASRLCIENLCRSRGKANTWPLLFPDAYSPQTLKRPIHLAPGGTFPVEAWRTSAGRPLDESQINNIWCQVWESAFLALERLVDLEICHREICPENIFLNAASEIVLVGCDYATLKHPGGISRHRRSRLHAHSRLHNSYHFQAPELRDSSTGEDDLTVWVDAWSLAASLLFIKRRAVSGDSCTEEKHRGDCVFVAQNDEESINKDPSAKELLQHIKLLPNVHQETIRALLHPEASKRRDGLSKWRRMDDATINIHPSKCLEELMDKKDLKNVKSRAKKLRDEPGSSQTVNCLKFLERLPIQNLDPGARRDRLRILAALPDETRQFLACLQYVAEDMAPKSLSRPVDAPAPSHKGRQQPSRMNQPPASKGTGTGTQRAMASHKRKRG